DIGGIQFAIPVWLTGLVLWAFVGVLSFVGAMCYAELATTYPTVGGDYGFISRAYGRAAGFVFAWSEMAIIRTGASIAAMAYVFADYSNRVWPLEKMFAGASLAPLGAHAGFTYAAVAILAMTTVNVLGLHAGKWTQNALTLVKLLGLAAVFVAGTL